MSNVTSIHPRCPRCQGFIPNNDTPGAYSGALSRADNRTEVCSACGSDEAMRQHFTGTLIPVEEWPVSDAHRYRIEVAL